MAWMAARGLAPRLSFVAPFLPHARSGSRCAGAGVRFSSSDSGDGSDGSKVAAAVKPLQRNPPRESSLHLRRTVPSGGAPRDNSPRPSNQYTSSSSSNKNSSYNNMGATYDNASAPRAYRASPAGSTHSPPSPSPSSPGNRTYSGASPTQALASALAPPLQMSPDTQMLFNVLRNDSSQKSELALLQEDVTAKMQESKAAALAALAATAAAARPAAAPRFKSIDFVSGAALDLFAPVKQEPVQNWGAVVSNMFQEQTAVEELTSPLEALDPEKSVLPPAVPSPEQVIKDHSDFSELLAQLDVKGELNRYVLDLVTPRLARLPWVPSRDKRALLTKIAENLKEGSAGSQ